MLLKFHGNSKESAPSFRCLSSEINKRYAWFSADLPLKTSIIFRLLLTYFQTIIDLFSDYYPLIICLFSDYYSLNIHLFSNAIMNNVKNILIKNTELHQIPHETRPEQDDSVTYLGQGQVVDRGG